MTDRTLAGFDVSTFTHDVRTHDVYRAGSGPAVIVIHELPGIHPGMVEFARRLIGEGYTVWLPSLFGRPVSPSPCRKRPVDRAGVCVAGIRDPRRPH
jgi:dienelactone hydrolase